MFGKNKILPYQKSDGLKLDIQEIFATFQGEGIYTGYPAIFIRLGGCNLACKFCDTEFESFKEYNLKDIIKKVNKLAKNNNNFTHNLAVITGGEPFRQNIQSLCKSLIKEKFLVQIETNGTLYQELPPEVKIICSPKNNGAGYYNIRPDLFKLINAFKFIISANNKNYNFVPDLGQKKADIPTYLQPMDENNEEKNQKNIKLTLNLAKKYGYRISLQTHKILNIR